ncbi:MAG: T9SS type A sorting domain-containing protein [Bacteroidota bacterium]
MYRLFFFLSVFLISSELFSQHTNVMISDQFDPNEPSIMINPRNTNQIVAGANLSNFYYSSNAGQSWTKGLISSSNGVWGDPTIIVDTTGSFYFFHLSNPPGGNWIDRIVCQKMSSLGATWSDGTYFGLNGTKAQDKQWAVVDPRNNNIYVTWTEFDQYNSSLPTDSSRILFVKSIDGGLTWSNPFRINHYSGDCLDMDSTTEGAVPAVGPNGELYVSWAGPNGIVFNKSNDEGATWLPMEQFVTDFPDGWDFMIPGINRSNGLPVTCCDISDGPYRGNIYINWIDHRNGANDPDVWLIKSSDGGQNWSLPIRVNDDGAGNTQFFTWMTVDQKTGYLYFVYYDRRNYNDNRTDVYMAVSKNGGDNFVNFKISTSPFTPVSSVFFGDYTNISACNNVVRPIWARCDTGAMSIWTALIDPVFLGTDAEPDNGLMLDQNSPNPFNGSTVFAFKLRRADKVSLKVFDIFGREVATLIDNEVLQPGKYRRQFDASGKQFSNGVYFFSLITSDKVVTKKMVLEK